MSMGYIAVAVAIAGSAVYTGEQTRKAQRRSMLARERAQKRAKAAATRQQIVGDKLAGMEKAKADKKRAGANQYLAAAQQAAKQGPASTLLTGTGGADGMLLGGRSTLVS